MRDEVRVVVAEGVHQFALLSRVVESALHNETLVELEVGISVEVDASGTVHLSVVVFDITDEAGNAFGHLFVRSEIFFFLGGLL